MQQIYSPHQEIDVTGGESVYCINEAQMAKALRMVHQDPETSQKLKDLISNLEENYSRNERAAVAFTIIQRLNGSAE